MWCVVLCLGEPISISPAQPVRYQYADPATARREFADAYVSNSFSCGYYSVGKILKSYWEQSTPYAYVFTKDPLDPLIPAQLTVALAQILEEKAKQLMKEAEAVIESRAKLLSVGLGDMPHKDGVFKEALFGVENIPSSFWVARSMK